MNEVYDEYNNVQIFTGRAEGVSRVKVFLQEKYFHSVNESPD